MENVLEADGFDDFFAKSDVVDVIKQIMMNYTNNKVIMQNCFLSLYYLSHLPVIRTMDDALFMIVQEYVSQSKNDAGTLQRFNRLCAALRQCSVC